MSIGESHFCNGHALDLLEVMLCSPETTTCKIDVLGGLCFQDSVYLMFYEWPCLALQQNAGLQALQPVPDVLRNIHAVVTALLTDDARVHYLTLVIVGCHANLSFQNHKGLVFVGMVMHWDKCAWFQSIEESVALVLKALMEVVVLP